MEPLCGRGHRLEFTLAGGDGPDYPGEFVGDSNRGFVVSPRPNDARSGVLEQIAKLRGELLVAVQDEPSLAAQKAVEWVGEIPTDLHHERAIWPGSYSGNVYFSRRQLDDDEHIVGHEPANRGDLDGEEVGRSNGFPMGGEKRCRILTMVLLATVWPRFERAPRMRVYPHFGFDFAIPEYVNITRIRSRIACFE